MNFVNKIKISITIALITSIIFSIYSFAKTSEQIRNDFIRLHVIANSDSAEDQSLKLSVRDYILNAGSHIFDGTITPQNVYIKVPEKLDELEEKVMCYIKNLGYSYDVTITLTDEYFSTRTYNTVTLPAGRYTALKVIIGEGNGKNWWCVMFPPMCISAANEQEILKNNLTSEEFSLVNRNPKYEVRFRIIEIIEEIKIKFKS